MTGLASVPSGLRLCPALFPVTLASALPRPALQIAKVKNQLGYEEKSGASLADQIAAKQAEVQREQEALQAARKEEKKHAKESEAVQVREPCRVLPARLPAGGWPCARDRKPFCRLFVKPWAAPAGRRAGASCGEGRQGLRRGQSLELLAGLGGLRVSPPRAAASRPAAPTRSLPAQAEIADLQRQVADKRGQLEALEAELKEYRDRVAAAKDAGAGALYAHAGRPPCPFLPVPWQLPFRS